jgi:hypothetical protein
MPPQFADPIAWEYAELLMQPAFIRVIDNIRKQLEQSTWKGTYRDVQVWSEEVPPEIQARVTQLQQQLVDASPEEAAAIEQSLAHLPRAYPGYELCLEQQGQHINVDLWDLCYQVCFDHYSPAKDEAIAIDTSLIDTRLIDETGDVDWQQLDKKAKQLVEQVFSQLPQPGAG